MEQSLAMAGLSAQDIGIFRRTARRPIAVILPKARPPPPSMATAPISSLKSYFGHTLGACGALEAWMSLQMMREGWFAPTLNLTTG
jgi:3-oxoacyl-[acyl-carrier-protein] synthase II